MSRKRRRETADDAESLPALQRRIGIPLFALVASLVLLAAGDSIHALLKMRAVSSELGRIASVDVAVQSAVRALVRTQLERRAALSLALGAAGADQPGAREGYAPAAARFRALGPEMERELREARDGLLHSGWSQEEIARTLRSLLAFESGVREMESQAEPLLSRALQGCDVACETDAVRLEVLANSLDLRGLELLEAASLSLDRSSELALASEEGFLQRSLVVSVAAFSAGLIISALLMRRILATLRRGIERREASEAELRRSEARLRAILDASLDPIVTICGDGVIRSASRAFERVFGWEPGTLVGRNVSVLMPEPHRSQHDGYIARYLRSGQATVIGQLRELEAERRDGTVFPCELWVNSVGVPPGDVPLFCGVLRDITERKRGESRLQQYASHLEVANLELADSSKALQDVIDQLRRSNEDLDEFAYVASHDLKEPLRGIRNYAQFLLEDYGDKLDSEGTGRLETLSRLAERLTSMIDALLEFSRLRRAELGMTRTDLHAVVCEVIESLQVTLRERNVEMRLPERLPTIVCSGVLVAEIFRNLIENAIKYNEKPECWIEIGVRPQAASASGRRGPLVFYVRDNGIGIRERHFESAFRILKRLNGRDRFRGGTGMGLTIVKKIVERHGGRVWIESTFGEGSTFLFTLCKES
jgi:PAS domain S-box-containing protein